MSELSGNVQALFEARLGGCQVAGLAQDVAQPVKDDRTVALAAAAHGLVRRLRGSPRGVECLQRKASGAAEAGTAPVDAWAHATLGRATEVPYRAEMEKSFGRSFGSVQAHLGGDGANQGLGALGAHAAAHGDVVAFRESSPSRGLVAHELAHVVQQSGGGAGVQAKSVGAQGGGAEQRADAAAEAVLRGEPVPDVGSADSDVVHLAVDTYGGRWNAPTYSATRRCASGSASWPTA